MTDSVGRLARKELENFFHSATAYIFLGAFLAVTLFTFFWVEAFFARNIADVRPLFEWMPLLLIFLSAALTMRSWSEERRTGTLEHVLTVPVPLWQFVLGKFLACAAILAIAVPAVLLPGLAEELEVGGEGEGQAVLAAAEPAELGLLHQRVEPRREVGLEPRRQELGFQQLCRRRVAEELL